MSVDFIPWRAENTSTGVSTKGILHREYSVGITEGEGILAGHYHKLQSFPQSWVVPPKQVISMVLVFKFLIRLLVYWRIDLFIPSVHLECSFRTSGNVGFSVR